MSPWPFPPSPADDEPSGRPVRTGITDDDLAKLRESDDVRAARVLDYDEMSLLHAAHFLLDPSMEYPVSGEDLLAVADRIRRTPRPE